MLEVGAEHQAVGEAHLVRRRRPQHLWERSIDPLHAAVLAFLCVFIPLAYATVLSLLRGVLWHQAWPFDSFLPSPTAVFGDWYLIHNQWLTYHFGAGPVSPGSVYFPATYLGVQLVETINTQHLPTLAMNLGLFLVGSIASIVSILRHRGVTVIALAVATLLTTYAVIFEIFTGNVEGWVCALTLGTLALTLRDHRTSAAVLLGFAVAMKGIPIVFLPLMWFGRTRRQSIISSVQCVGAAIATTLVAMLALPGGGPSAFGRIITDVRNSQNIYFKQLMMYTSAGTHYGNSFLNGVHAFFGEQAMLSKQWWLVVVVVGGALLGGAVVYALHQHVPLWMVLALCASAGCLLVPVSGDYKLMYFMPAIVSLLAEEAIPVRWLPGLVVLCLIPTPKPWGLRPGPDPFADAGVYLTPLLMVILCGWVVYYAATTNGPAEASGRAIPSVALSPEASP